MGNAADNKGNAMKKFWIGAALLALLTTALAAQDNPARAAADARRYP